MHKIICRNAKPQWSITWFHSAKSGVYARLSVKQGMIGHKRRILRWELKGRGDASGLVDRKLGQRRGYDMLQFSGRGDTRVEERHFTQRGKLLTDNLLPSAHKKLQSAQFAPKPIHLKLRPVHLKPPTAGTEGAPVTATGDANRSSGWR